MEQQILGKIKRRLIPIMFLMLLFSFLDRLNISFAALTMKHDLGLSDAVYGLGAGVFFLGYFLFEIPSNLILERVGARRWIARIMVTWGVVAACTMFVRSPAGFYGMRFLLGLAEAGFLPGMFLYLTYWIPADERGRTLGLFMAAIPISGIVGGPLAGALFGLDGRMGLAGWQWIFLGEGVPTILLGIAGYFVLADRPDDAVWLGPTERAWLADRLRRERESLDAAHPPTFMQALGDRRILVLSAVYVLAIIAGYGVSFWLPQILKSASGWSNGVVTALVAIPSLLGAIGMVVIGVHSDQTRERRRHVALATGVAAVSVGVASRLGSPIALLAAFSAYEFAKEGLLIPFWAMASDCFSGTAAAGGLAFINSVGALGGFLGPTVMGVLKQETRGYSSGLMVLAAVLAMSALLVLTVRHEPILPRTDVGSGSDSVDAGSKMAAG